MTSPENTRVLHLLASAASPVLDIEVPIRLAHERGWDVCVGLTPTAARWLEGRIGELEALTGRPVRSASRMPGDPDVWPAADALLVAPGSLNTVNKIALGLGDVQVVRAAIDAIGLGTPLTVLPCVNTVLAAHPQFARSVEVLRGAGVRVLLGGDSGFVPNPPGGFRRDSYPWGPALDAVGR